MSDNSLDDNSLSNNFGFDFKDFISNNKSIGATNKRQNAMVNSYLNKIRLQESKKMINKNKATKDNNMQIKPVEESNTYETPEVVSDNSSNVAQELTEKKVKSRAKNLLKPILEAHELDQYIEPFKLPNGQLYNKQYQITKFNQAINAVINNTQGGFIYGLSVDFNFRIPSIILQEIHNLLLGKDLRCYWFNVLEHNAEIKFINHINEYSIPHAIMITGLYAKMNVNYYDKVRQLVELYSDMTKFFIVISGTNAVDFFENIINLPYDGVINFSMANNRML